MADGIRQLTIIIILNQKYFNPNIRGRDNGQETQCRDLEADTRRLGLTWSQLETNAQDRDDRRTLVGGLHIRKDTRQK